MKKVGKRVRPFHVECPFCGFLNVAVTTYSWCGGCYVEYTRNKRSGRVTFDTELKTDRFIWAIALAKAGGMRMGSIAEEEKERNE